MRTNFVRTFDAEYLTYKYEDDRGGLFIAYRIMLYVYLDLHAIRDVDVVMTSLGEMLNVCGIDVRNYKQRKSYAVFLEVISWFIQNNYIEVLNTDLDSSRIDALIKIQLLEDFYPGLETVDRIAEPFVKITRAEFELTRGNPKLLFVYAYIKSFIFGRRQGDSIRGHPMCVVLSAANMANATKINRHAVMEYIDELEKLNIIARGQLDKTGKKSPPYAFVIKKDNWEQELEFGMEKYNKNR